MRTPKFKAQSTNVFFAAISLGSCRKHGGAAKHLIDGSKKGIFRLSFEFWSPHVIEKRSKTPVNGTFDSRVMSIGTDFQNLFGKKTFAAYKAQHNTRMKKASFLRQLYCLI